MTRAERYRARAAWLRVKARDKHEAAARLFIAGSIAGSEFGRRRGEAMEAEAVRLDDMALTFELQAAQIDAEAWQLARSFDRHLPFFTNHGAA